MPLPLRLIVTDIYKSQNQKNEWDRHSIPNQYIEDTLKKLELKEGKDYLIEYIPTISEITKYITNKGVTGVIIPVSAGDNQTLDQIKKEAKFVKQESLIKRLKRKGQVFEAWRFIPEYRSNTTYTWGISKKGTLHERAQRAHEPFRNWIEKLYTKHL